MQKRLSVFKQQKLYDPNLHDQAEGFLRKIYANLGVLQEMVNDPRKSNKNYYAEVPIEKSLELIADWPMAPENRAELDDTIWALRALVDEEKLLLARVVLMDWDPDRSEQVIGTRSMLNERPNPLLLPEDQSINNIFQGRGGKYPGDDQMKFDDALTIQVHRIAPILDKKRLPDVVALALIVPNNTSGFVVELPARKGSK
jgi:hypothetical protein